MRSAIVAVLVVAAAGFVIGAATLPSVARAEDGIRPRTPVVWPSETPCMLTVDRSVDPVLNLPYAIALEDPPEGESISDDEVVDGRRHQFLAFRTDIDPRIALPQWISQADVMAAAMLGLVDPEMIEADDLLDTHPVLGTEVVRIDADDARRPITFDAADAGADWDTTAFAAGTWIVRAYTWDPWPSRWAQPRRGAVRIVDDAAMPMVGPALAVGMDPPILHRDDLGTIEGCIVADEGTVLSAAWALATDPTAEFVEFASDVPVNGDAIAIAFAPPEALWGSFAVLRVSAIDPEGRRYDAFVADRITILATDAGGESSTGDPWSSESSTGTTTDGDSSGTTTTDVATTSGGTTTSSGGSEATSSADAVPGESGCGCASTAPRSWLHFFAILGLLAPRRRRAAVVIIAVASCVPSRSPSSPPSRAAGRAPPAAGAIDPPPPSPTWTAMSLAQSRAFEVAQAQVEHGRVCARSRRGEVACWGDQFRIAQGGSGWAPPTSTPHRLEGIDDAQDLVLAGGLFVLRSDGTIVFARDSRLVAVDGFAAVEQIESASRSICARLRDGRVRCRGDLDWPRADATASVDITVPIDLALPPATSLACGLTGCCSWSADGIAHCVGDDTDLEFSARPRRLPFTGVTSIAIGDETACATTTKGTKCWGESLTRWFGDDWIPPRHGTVIPAGPPCVLTNGELSCVGRDRPITLSNVAAVASFSGTTSCAVLRSGAMSCWGDNENGSFADGVAMSRTHPALVDGISTTRITASHDDSCAVTSNGELSCWGRQRGKPMPAGLAAAVAVNAQYSATCGIATGVVCRVPGMGGSDDVLHWSFTGSIRAAAIDRAQNVCIVDERGSVRCQYSLGENGTDSSWAALAVPEPVASIVAKGVGFVFASTSGHVFEWADGRFDEDPDFVDAPKTTPKAKAVAIDPVTEIAAHQNGGCAVTRKGDTVCWGGIGFARDWAGDAPKTIDGLRDAHGLAANHFHVCGIVGDEARCFGDNEWGQLGRVTDGDGAARAERVDLPAAVAQVAVGAEHTCAALVDHRVFCWGSDRAGQLGQGRVIRSDQPVASVLGPSQSQ